ncbi:MAG: TPM domain-containing protein [Clostridiales bacterium]|nr:TPM domain-containing protein [Clostridiales bacterium]
MKQYFLYFKWLFAITALLGLIYAGTLTLHSAARAGERENTECLTSERVFDYGNVLSDKEENKLRELIAKREKQTGCDIVIVTLNESLKEYARDREPDVSYEEFVRVYAEEFYDENKFGYDKPIGDGVLLVDNWFREDNGKIYTWLCTVGKADEKYGSALVDHLLDNVYRYVEKNPYKAYKTYVNEVYHDMTGTGEITAFLPYWLPFVLSVVIALIFIAVHWSYKKGKKTTLATTYVSGGEPGMNRKEDTLINKVVTKRHIERSSESGGGIGSGGSSGGGGHHGGGGHSR